MAWLAPHLVGPDPGGRAGQPAGAGRAVRRDHHRGARLPARGREHARRRHDVRRARTARLRGAAPAPLAGHASHARDGAARRLPLRRRRRHARGRHRHRGGRTRRHDRVPRGRHDARHLPRRPARGQPVRAAEREDRAARLRHHRPAGRDRSAWRCSRMLVGASNERRPGPGGGHARPRRACPTTSTCEQVIAQLGLDRPPIDPTTAHPRRARRRDAALGQGAARPRAPACPRS